VPFWPVVASGWMLAVPFIVLAKGSSCPLALVGGDSASVASVPWPCALPAAQVLHQWWPQRGRAQAHRERRRSASARCATLAGLGFAALCCAWRPAAAAHLEQIHAYQFLDGEISISGGGEQVGNEFSLLLGSGVALLDDGAQRA
jgi:hypothetical protein